MKEKEVHLSIDEIDYLLQGSIHWNDIESRVNAPLRKPIQSIKSEGPLGKSEPKLNISKVEEYELDEPPQSQEWKESQPFLEGNKVYWLLSGVSILTIGTWVYFVFAS
jgi:hypothetical protein